MDSLGNDTPQTGDDGEKREKLVIIFSNALYSGKSITQIKRMSKEEFPKWELAINEVMQLILARDTDQRQALLEARYMGTADFMQWILQHDETSFRQERAWFKVKPGLLLKYQADLMENLGRIRTMMGIDPDSTVKQVHVDEKRIAALNKLKDSPEGDI